MGLIQLTIEDIWKMPLTKKQKNINLCQKFKFGKHKGKTYEEMLKNQDFVNGMMSKNPNHPFSEIAKLELISVCLI